MHADRFYLEAELWKFHLTALLGHTGRASSLTAALPRPAVAWQQQVAKYLRDPLPPKEQFGVKWQFISQSLINVSCSQQS